MRLLSPGMSLSLSHASASQVSVLIASAFWSRLQMSLKSSLRFPVGLFPVAKVLGNTAVLHHEAFLLEYGVHGGDPCPLHHCVVEYFVSPGDAQGEPQAAHVEGVESSLLLRAQSP